MSETNVPAAEAVLENGHEVQAYEFAFHVLPTVAEGEVPGVFESLKAHITKAGGEIFDTEEPERFDLAYEIVKHLEGKNRKFGSAYFGWIRFRVEAGALTALTEELDSEKSLLRYLLIKLTKMEEQNPFRFHESIAHRKVVTISDEELADISAEATTEGEAEVAEATEVAEGGVAKEEDGEAAK